MKYSLWTLLQILVIGFVSCNNSQPKTLSGEERIIDIEYIEWACECPRFVEVENSDQGLDYDLLASKCFYIQASKLACPITEEYYGGGHATKYLRLTGQFYQDEGVPSDYEPVTSQIPLKAKVFRYDKVEYIDRD